MNTDNKKADQVSVSDVQKIKEAMGKQKHTIDNQEFDLDRIEPLEVLTKAHGTQQAEEVRFLATRIQLTLI